MFFQPDLQAFTVDRDREFHHWHSGSEVVAVGSQLYSALLNGWQASTQVIRKEITLGGGRRTSIFYFELFRDDTYMTMPVQENPAVVAFLRAEPFSVENYAVAPKVRFGRTALAAEA